jgi:hypothetical protein
VSSATPGSAPAPCGKIFDKPEAIRVQQALNLETAIEPQMNADERRENQA